MIWPFSLKQTDAEQIEQLVSNLKKNIAPEVTVNRAEAMSVNKTTRVIERVVKSFQTYDENRRLGYFARVRFFHQLEWKLRDTGYSKEFVDLVLEGLLMTRRVEKNNSQS